MFIDTIKKSSEISKIKTTHWGKGFVTELQNVSLRYLMFVFPLKMQKSSLSTMLEHIDYFNIWTCPALLVV